MRARMLLAAGFTASLAIGSSASAQTNISGTAQFSPTNTIVYTPFHVTAAGTFEMQTFGLNPIDPMISLFSGFSTTGAGLGALLGGNDDGGPAQAGFNVCNGLGGSCHSYFASFLGAGWYTFALSAYELTEAEARAGANPDFQTAPYQSPPCNLDQDWGDCSYGYSITSLDGDASTVPEPATMTLLASGLVGLAAARRRKKNAA